MLSFVKAGTFDNLFVYNPSMGTGSTLAAFASLDHVPRPWLPALCRGFGLFVEASDTLQAVLHESLRIVIEGIDVRFTTVLHYDLDKGSGLMLADVGSRSGLVGRVRIASESGIVASLAVAPRAAIILHDLDRKSGSHTSMVLATCCLRARGPMPPPSVSHHA